MQIFLAILADFCYVCTIKTERYGNKRQFLLPTPWTSSWANLPLDHNYFYLTTNMKGIVLNDRELLMQTAFGLIGISLPEVFVIRLAMLEDMAKEKGLGEISIHDGVTIEKAADEEFERRCRVANARKED